MTRRHTMEKNQSAQSHPWIGSSCSNTEPGESVGLVPDSASYATNSLHESQPVMISRAGVGSPLSRIPPTREASHGQRVVHDCAGPGCLDLCNYYTDSFRGLTGIHSKEDATQTCGCTQDPPYCKKVLTNVTVTEMDRNLVRRNESLG